MIFRPQSGISRQMAFVSVSLIVMGIAFAYVRSDKEGAVSARLIVAETFSKIERLKEAKMLFVGDMMFDRTMRKIADDKGYGYLFSCVDGYLQGFDAVIGNLEGPITGSPSKSSGTKPGEEGNTTFTFDVSVAKALRNSNVRFVSLGNNHIFDFGKTGSESTKQELGKEGISHFGAPGGDLYIVANIEGRKVSFISFNQFLGQNDPQRTVQAIWDAKKESDYVFVYSHWGEEYAPATEYMKSLAHTFLDAGADMVIGSHPHVIQEHEIYDGKHIFYSLGNFIFDQYWNEEVSTGAGIEVTLGPKIEVEERKFSIGRDGRTCLQEARDR